MPMIIIYVYF